MNKLDPFKVKYLVLHCTDSVPSNTTTVDIVRQWHLKRGFEDIGYHYLILPSGEIQLGRSEEFVGAHCVTLNSKSIGIAYVGGRNAFGVYLDTRTYNQKISLAYLMRDLVVRYPTIEKIVGHNDYSTKVCPCFDARFEYRDFISKIRANLP